MIYFIKHTDFVKIGYTSDICRRLSQLQISCPVKLQVIGIVEGTIEDESNYHAQFDKFHSHGEWYCYSRELEDFIDKLNKDLMWKYGYIHEDFNVLGVIKYCRLKEKLSLEELGEKLGVTKQAILDMQSREIHGKISIANMIKTLSALGYRFQYRAVKAIN